MTQRTLRQTCVQALVLGYVAILFWLGALPQARAQAAPTRLVLGTPSPENNFVGAYVRRIHRELFARLGLGVDFLTLPVARLNVETANNRVDGDSARALAFGQSQPQLIRVAEPVMEVNFALWAINPSYLLSSPEQLAGSGYSVSFDRGTLVCEQFLKEHLPAQRIVDVTTLTSALEMLHYGRHELHCGIDITVLAYASEFFPRKPPPLRLFNLGKPTPLYAYLQPQHAALALPMAAALRKMRADGTLERIRRETLRDFELPVN
ncbi:MAG: hypothetical protein ACT4NV_06955 [Rhodoferax sp.]